MRSLLTLTLFATAGWAVAQGQSPDITAALKQVEDEGVEVRLKDIARFRGVRSNQLTGIGLVMGLEGTGDSKKSQATQTVLANLLKDFGTVVDPRSIDAKNVALVTITAELPPFAKPGTRIDVRVSSIGDAKSLQGGTLLQAPLYAAGNREVAYCVAEGPVSIGGFNVGGGGSTVQRNHSTVGLIPGGGIVENSVQTKVLFNGTLFLELDTADLTTANRVASKINEMPNFYASALDGATVSVSVPEDIPIVQAMSVLERVSVFADTPAAVVINERTGTIVVGGNVRLGPAAIAHGGLNVRIQTFNDVSQPAPFSRGETVEVKNTEVDVEQEPADIAMLPPSATVQDLARIFQALRLKPTDIIAILQALRAQGALKARIEIQ